MSGRSCGRSAGARNVGSARPASATKGRSAAGSARPGPALKKSLPTRPHDRLHRRKRINSEAASLPHLGAARRDAGPGVQLQLEEAFGSGRAELPQLLLPAVPWRDRGTRGHRLPEGLGRPHPRAATDRLGPTAGAPQPSGRGVHRALRGSHRNGVPAALCAGAEPGGIHLVLLEAARTAQRLPEGLWGTRPTRSPSTTPHAPQAAFDCRFLEAVFSLFRLTGYYTGLSRRGKAFSAYVPARPRSGSGNAPSKEAAY